MMLFWLWLASMVLAYTVGLLVGGYLGHKQGARQGFQAGRDDAVAAMWV